MITHSIRQARFAVAAAVIIMAGTMGLTAGTAVAGQSAPGHHPVVLYVSPNAAPKKDRNPCDDANYSTIQSAIDAAPPAATVVVCPGTYHEQLVVSKALTLKGENAIVDEKGVTPNFVVPPPVGPLPIFAAVVIISSHVSFSGFTVQNALGEGILAATVPPNPPTGDITIAGNKILSNDLGGGNPPASAYFECQENGQIPGDCGEGIHFIGVAFSTIGNNFISGNSGGILLTDETGPTHDNLIQGNVVTKNESDCGITVPGHNPNALDASGKRQPTVAGVYRNAIIGNTITDNGHLGEGAGVLFANASGGTASYDNLVQGNYIAGNQLAGVTLHAHLLDPADPAASKGEDLNGNRIVNNIIGQNMVPGMFVHGDDLDGVVTVTDTTGVLVWAGPVSVKVTIVRNHIANNHFGIWLGRTANVVGTVHSNSFNNVFTPVETFA
jgi:hypothetical protein